MVKIYSDQLDEEAAHRLLKSCVVPRPIAWVSTLSGNGIRNLAPFSCYTFVATKPPIIALSIAPREKGKKDTLTNIEESGEYVVHVVSRRYAKEVTATSAETGSGVDEWEVAAVTALASDGVRPFRIAECPVAMECRLLRELEIGESRHTLVLGEVVLFHVQDELVSGGVVDVAAMDPLVRLSDDLFSGIGKVFEIRRGKPDAS